MACTDSYKVTEKNQLRRKIFNILIVDDDVDVAENLQKLLELRGHNITIVDDGLRCITHCKDKDKYYDIIFLDYHMDGLDGAEVADIVKQDGKKTLIFAYTGDSSQRALNDFKEVGMDAVIIKPIDIKSIDLLMTKLEQTQILNSSVIKNITKKSSRSILFFSDNIVID